MMKANENARQLFPFTDGLDIITSLFHKYIFSSPVRIAGIHLKRTNPECRKPMLGLEGIRSGFKNIKPDSVREP